MHHVSPSRSCRFVTSALACARRRAPMAQFFTHTENARARSVVHRGRSLCTARVTTPHPDERTRMTTKPNEIGSNRTVFLDKLGERLAFTRAGSRVYEAVLARLGTDDVSERGPTRAELEQMRDD